MSAVVTKLSVNIKDIQLPKDHDARVVTEVESDSGFRHF